MVMQMGSAREEFCQQKDKKDVCTDHVRLAQHHDNNHLGTTRNSAAPYVEELSRHEKASRRKHVREMETLLGYGEGSFPSCPSVRLLSIIHG